MRQDSDALRGWFKDLQPIYDELFNAAYIMCGNYDQMSFAFIVKDDEITRDDKGYHRVIKSVGKLFDISAVSFPANPNTSIGIAARSAFDGFIEEEKRLELAKAEEARKLEEAKKHYKELQE